MRDSRGEAALALLVLPEAGVDPRPALASASACAPRCLARLAAVPAPAAAATATLPDGVTVFDARSPRAAILRAAASAESCPLLVMNAGERLVRLDAGHAAPSRAGLGSPAPAEYAVRRARLRVTLAGGAVEGARWFPGREPRIVARRGAVTPSVELERTAQELSAIVRALDAAAAEYDAPPESVGAARLLGGPALAAARIYLAGAWRSGFRGFLFAALHGLFWLIVFTRSWLRTSNDSRSAAE